MEYTQIMQKDGEEIVIRAETEDGLETLVATMREKGYRENEIATARTRKTLREVHRLRG